MNIRLFIIAMAVVILTVAGCCNRGGDFIEDSSPKFVSEDTISTNQDGSLDMHTQSGVTLRADKETFDSNVNIKITENKSFEGIDSKFSNTSSLFTISAEKIETSSLHGQSKSTITTVDKPVYITVPNRINKNGVYFLGMRPDSNQPWKFALINDDNSSSKPLTVNSRLSLNNYSAEFHFITFNVSFQFSIFYEIENDPARTVITDLKAEAEPSEYELADGRYKDDIKIKTTVYGDNLSNLSSDNIIVEIGFLNDNNIKYTANTFPITGAIANYDVSDTKVGTGNRYKHTVTLTNISDFNNNTLTFGIGTSQLPMEDFPTSFTVTVKVPQAPKILPFEKTIGLTLNSKAPEKKYIKVVSTTPANGTTNASPNSGNVIIKFDNELADNDWASFITFSDASGSLPIEVTYADKTLYINHGPLEVNNEYNLEIKPGIKGIESDSEIEPFNLTFTTHPMTVVTATLLTPSTTSDIALDTNVILAFSGDISWEPEYKEFVTISSGTSSPIECTYSYSPANHLLTVTPAENLLFNSKYLIKISKNLTLNNPGAHMDDDQQFEFTTIASETTPIITPDTSKSVDGKYYLVANQKFNIDFNKEIDVEIAKQNIYMQKDGSDFTDFSVDVSANKLNATINVNVPFEAAKTYKAGVKEFSAVDGTILKSADTTVTAMPALTLEKFELDQGSGWQLASGSTDVIYETGKFRLTFNQPVNPAKVQFTDKNGLNMAEPVVSTSTTDINSVLEFNYNNLKYLTTYNVVISVNDTTIGQCLESDVYAFETTYPRHLVLADESLENSITNPYVVYCAQALDEIRLDEYRDHGWYFKQMRDIDLSPSVYTSETNTTTNGWKCFGEYDGWNGIITKGFSGHYDGNEKTISNLKCITSNSNECPSLFGAIKDGSVKDLAVESVEISGMYNTGAIAGCVATATIENCHSSGNITCSNYRAGGLIGHAFDSDGSIIIKDCSSNANVTITYSNEKEFTYAGGLIGDMQNGSILSSNVTNCTIKGQVYAGGLAGSIYRGTVADCYTSDIIINAHNSIGGLIGCIYASSTITNCHCDSVTLTGTNEYTYAGNGVGGIVGEAENTTIDGCETSGTISGYSVIGGIAGKCNTGSIKNATSTCEVSSVYYYAGGIAGLANCDIINCCSNGSITAGSDYAGGITGQLASGKVAQNSSSVGNIKGAGKVGGVIGHNYGTIENCSSIGDITGKTIHPSYAYSSGVGGIAGNNEGIIQNCRHEGYVLSPGNNVGGISGYMTGSTASIIKSQQTGDVTGYRYVGGIVGYLKSGVVPESGSDVNSFSGTGTVTGGTSGAGYTFGSVYGYKE